MTGSPRPGAADPLPAAIGWQARAACRGADPELFFVPEAERVTARKRRETKAKAICAGCAVRIDCLEWRLDSPDQMDGGIWGGAGEEERTRLRRLRLRAATRRAAA
jgi:WhiB family redox-sensing transcriptional regulator